jgi:hypothetical protein
MFAEGLRKAIEDRNRAAICWLIESMSPDCWSCVANPPHAQAWQDDVGIAMHHVSGGSGIDTYDSVSVSVLWADGRVEFGGQYTADELRLPNYVPVSRRRCSETV